MTSTKEPRTWVRVRTTWHLPKMGKHAKNITCECGLVASADASKDDYYNLVSIAPKVVECCPKCWAAKDAIKDSAK